MKILCAIKRVIDYNIKININGDNSGVITDGVKMSINPFDEIAVEEALRIKEKGQADEVIIASIGSTKSQEQIRQALAMGADRGILIETDNDLETLNVAKILQKIIDDEKIDLVLLGKQAIDNDCNHTAQMLAALTQMPVATFASEVKITDNKIDVTREVDGGLQTINLAMPAIISTDLRLNEPRYASLPNIMKAKQKPLDIKPLADLNIEYNNRIETISVNEPPTRTGGGKVNNVDEFIEKLKDCGA